LSEPTEIFHNDIRSRYDRGETIVIDAMQRFAEIADEGREALMEKDYERLEALIDENFDTRRQIYRLPEWQIQMVETARECGASAKFAGSGGAIIGFYKDQATYQRLCDQLAQIGSEVITPQL